MANGEAPAPVIVNVTLVAVGNNLNKAITSNNNEIKALQIH